MYNKITMNLNVVQVMIFTALLVPNLSSMQPGSSMRTRPIQQPIQPIHHPPLGAPQATRMVTPRPVPGGRGYNQLSAPAPQMMEVAPRSNLQSNLDLGLSHANALVEGLAQMSAYLPAMMWASRVFVNQADKIDGCKFTPEEHFQPSDECNQNGLAICSGLYSSQVKTCPIASNHSLFYVKIAGTSSSPVDMTLTKGLIDAIDRDLMPEGSSNANPIPILLSITNELLNLALPQLTRESLLQWRGIVVNNCLQIDFNEESFLRTFPNNITDESSKQRVYSIGAKLKLLPGLASSWRKDIELEKLMSPECGEGMPYNPEERIKLISEITSTRTPALGNLCGVWSASARAVIQTVRGVLQQEQEQRTNTASSSSGQQ
jgi:hypothetical protein